jgi:hypothetical protein
MELVLFGMQDWSGSPYLAVMLVGPAVNSRTPLRRTVLVPWALMTPNTEMVILHAVAKQGPSVLFCMLNRNNCILLVSVMILCAVAKQEPDLLFSDEPRCWNAWLGEWGRPSLE